LIKRAALVGGAAWTAPLIIGSIASPAAAASTAPCPSCAGNAPAGQATFNITNSGSNGTATCVTGQTTPAGCRPACYTAGADLCTALPFTTTTNKSGNDAGVVFQMTGSAMFLGGTSYAGASCRPINGVVSNGGATLTFIQQLANSTGYNVSITWCS
jgi:hypothetical protein